MDFTTTTIDKVYLYAGTTYLTEANISVALVGTINVRIVATGSTPTTLTVYINDSLEITHEQSTGTDFTSGHPGFGASETGGVVDNTIFDNWTDGAATGTITTQTGAIDLNFKLTASAGLEAIGSGVSSAILRLLKLL